MGSRYSPLVSFMLVFVLFLFICYNWTNKFVYIKKTEIKGLFIWSGGPRSSGVCFFCFHALGGHKTKETYPTRLGSATPCKQGLILRYVAFFVKCGSNLTRMKSKLLYGCMVCYLCLFTHSFSSPKRKYMKQLLFVTNRLIPLLKQVHRFRISITLQKLNK